MRWQAKQPIDRYKAVQEWHDYFALWPVRNDTSWFWLETIKRRLVVDSEGNWAGGYMCHWEYK